MHDRHAGSGAAAALDQAKLLLKKPKITDVLAGVAQIDAAGDPDLWRHLAAGLSLDAAGALSVGGEIKATVKAGNRAQVALYAARRAGLLDGRTALALTGSFFDHAALPDLTPLAGLPVRWLWLRYLGLPDLVPLRDLPELRDLLITFSAADLSGLAPLTGLRTLELSDLPAGDLGPLAGLSGLDRLKISHMPVTDLRPLAGLSGLRALQLTYLAAPAPDLKPLAGLAGLEELDLSWWGATPDLSPLAGLTGLRRLNLSGLRHPAPDLRPLAGLAGLEEISLMHVPDPDFSPISHLAARRYR